MYTVAVLCFSTGRGGSIKASRGGVMLTFKRPSCRAACQLCLILSIPQDQPSADTGLPCIASACVNTAAAAQEAGCAVCERCSPRVAR